MEQNDMRCNLKCKELPKKCPKCNKKLKSEKCTCGHRITQEETNEEKEYFRRLCKSIFW